MILKHETPIEIVLRLRGITGRELAQTIGAGETDVSKWRNGLRISDKRREVIIRKLKLTDAEIAEIGWEVPDRV
jgi:hypothetical protein